MRHLILLSLSILIIGCNSNMSSRKYNSWDRQECYIEYSFYNPSLGPELGQRELAVVVKNGKLIDIKDLQHTNQDSLNDLGKPGVREIVKLINGNLDSSFKVIYKNSKPIKIYPNINNNIVGASYIIDIKVFKCN